MEVTETVSEGLKREYRCVIGADQIRAKVDAKLREIAGNISLPGFRPGKVPVRVVQQRYGRAITGEVIDEAVRDSVQEAIEGRGLRPATQPQIEVEEFTEGADFTFRLRTELLPEIEPMDFAGLSVERLEVEVPESEVEAAITRLAEGTAERRPIESPRPARNGDVLVIDFAGKVDGELFAGGEAADYELELGTGNFIPGFEEQLVGIQVGEAPTVTVRFPEDYGAEHLAGKEATFDVTVKEIKEKVEPVVDDALAKRVGADSLEDLRAKVRERLGQQYGGVTRGLLKRKLFDILDERHIFALPDGLVEQEFEGIWAEVQKQLDGPDPDEVREGKSDDELRVEYRKVAERRVRLGLLLSDVGRRNNISVNQDDLTRAVRARAAAFPGQEETVLRYYQENPAALAQLQAPILEDKVVDYVLELAQVTTRRVSPEDLAKTEAAATEAAATETTRA